MQGRLIVLPDGSERRAYTAVQAANALGITAKTLVAWTDATRRSGARLDGRVRAALAAVGKDDETTLHPPERSVRIRRFSC